MSRGAQKPTALRMLEGGRSHSLPNPERVNEPQPAKVMPRKPQFLDTHAKYIWDQLAPKLFAVGLLTEIDGFGLAMLCQTVSRQRDIEEALCGKDGRTELLVDQRSSESIVKGKIRGGQAEHEMQGHLFENGTTVAEQVPNPLILMSRQNMETFRKWAKEYGLTPTARAGLAIGSETDDGEDLLD